MGNDNHAHHSFDKIDIEMFFGLLWKKLDEGKREIVTAALAESVDRSAVARVLCCSGGPQMKIDELRKALRAKANPVTG